MSNDLVNRDKQRTSGGHKPAGSPTKRLSRRITGGLMPAALAPRVFLLTLTLVALVLCLDTYSSLCQAQSLGTRQVSNGTFTFTLEFYGTTDGEPWNLSTLEMDAIERGVIYWMERLNPQTGGAVAIEIGTLNYENASGGHYGSSPPDWSTPHEAIVYGWDIGLGSIDFGTMNWVLNRNTQLQEVHGVSLEAVAIHEMGHVLGILDWGPWLDLCDLSNPAAPVFQGQTARNVFGDVWNGGTGMDVPLWTVGGLIPDPGHFNIRNGLMTHLDYRNYAGFMEAEIAGLNDMGYNINLRQFFGRSVYVDNQTIIYTGGYSQHNGTAYLDGVYNTASYGLGLHVFADNTDITVSGKDILTIGEGGAGIRSDGSYNTIRIDEGIKVHANGIRGTGLLVSFGVGTDVVHKGDLRATGDGGIAARFDFGYNTLELLEYDSASLGDVLVRNFDVYGQIEGNRAAIYIAENAWVDSVNFYGGSHIIGNITSDSTYNTTWQTQITPVLGGDDLIITRIDGNITIPGRTFTVTNGSTLSMGDNTITASTVRIDDGGTLAVSTGTTGFATLDIVGTLDMAGSSILQVGIGLASSGISPSDMITVTTASIAGIITIDLLSTDLFAGTYNLIKANTLTYANVDDTLFLHNGEAFLTDGRVAAKASTSLTTLGADEFLQLLIETSAGSDDDNYHLRWTGAEDKIWINTNVGDVGVMNWRDTDNSQNSWFMNGDTVTFDLPAGDTITIDETHGVIVVSDMIVSGTGNWTFNGGGITGDGTATTLTGADGSLTMASTGMLTLNNVSEFKGGTIIENGMLLVGGTDATDAPITTASLKSDIEVQNGATLGGHGILNGSVTLESGATLSPGGGTVAIGTLNITGDLALINATLAIDIDNSIPLNDLIAVTGDVTFSGTNNKVAVSTGAENDTYVILTAGSGMTTLDTNTFAAISGIGADGYAYIRGSKVQLDPMDSTILQLVLDTDKEITLTWLGTLASNTWQSIATAHGNWTDNPGGTAYETHFRDGDSVIFDSHSTNSNVAVHEDGVTVNTMEVNASHNFSGGLITATGAVTVGSGVYLGLNISDNTPALITDSITFGTGSTLNITGYTAEEPWDARSPMTVIRSNNAIVMPEYTAENQPSVAVAGQQVVDFLSANAHLANEDKEIEVFVELTWYSTALKRPAHGDFTIDAGNEFELGVILLNNTDSTNWRSDWFGDSLTKLGAGTLILTANNTYDGGTTVSAGTLQLGNNTADGWVKGNIENNGNVAFYHSDDKAFENVISGTGTLTKMGENILTLTKNNTYTGTTTVQDGTLILTGNNKTTRVFIDNAGTLQLGKNTAAGWVDCNIENNGNVTFYRSDSIVFDHVISGTGTLNKLGAGALTLNGVNTYTGLTTVEAGTLFVGDSTHSTAQIAGKVNVLSGATLGGYGTIGGQLTLKDGSKLTPGKDNAIGMLTAKGDVDFQTGSTYWYDIDIYNGGNPGASTDRLVAKGANVTIGEDALLYVNLLNINGRPGNLFPVIQAGSIDGKFTLAGEKAWRFTNQGFVGDVYGLLWTSFEDIIGPFGIPNATSAAKGISKISEDENTIDKIGSLYSALDDLENPESMVDAFAQLHGEVFATNKEAAAQLQRNFQKLMPNGREIVGVNDKPKVLNRWGTLTGDWNNRARIGQYSGYNLSSAGFAIGVDRTLTPNLLAGAALGYDFAYLNFDSIRSKSEMDAFHSMLYGSWFNGSYYVDAYGGYTKNFYDTRRNININNKAFSTTAQNGYNNNAFSATARSRYHDDMGSVGIEVGRTQQMGDYLLTPSLGLHYIHLWSPNVTEKDGGEANLHVACGEYQSFRLPIGVKASRIFTGERGVVWMPEARMFYIRELADDSAGVQTAFVAVPSAMFEADGGKWGRNSGRLGAGVNAQLSNRVNLRVDYDYEIYNYTSAHVATATLGVQW